MRRHWLQGFATIAFILAGCGGDAPKDVEKPAVKHKKKHKKHADDEEDASADAPKKSSKKKELSAEDKKRQQEIDDEKEAQERRERIRKREQEEAEAEEKTVASKDDGGGGGDAAAKDDGGGGGGDDASSDEPSDDDKKAAADEAKAKKAEKAEAAREAKKQKAEEAKAKREAAAEAKKQKAEEAKAKREAAAEAKKKKNKHSEEVEVASSDDSSEDADAEETKPEKPDKKESKAKGKSKSKAETKKEKAKEKEKDKDKESEPEVASSDDSSEDADADETKPEKKETKPDKKETKGKGKGRGKGKEKKEEVDEAEIEVDDSSSNLPPPDPTEESKELDLTSGAVPTRDDGEDTATVVATPTLDRRPLTTSKSNLEVHGGPRVAVISASNGMGGSTTATAEAMGLGATYGLSPKAEVGFDYSFGLHPGSAKGPLLIHGAYTVKTSEKLDIALSGGFGIDFISAPDPAMPTMLTTRTAKALQVGIWARYHVTPKASLFTGLPALPSSSSSLAGAAALPPITNQLTIGLGSREAIAFEVPVGVGYQATPKFYGLAMLNLAHLGMSNSTSAFLFADYIPLGLGGFYVKDKLDIGAVFSDDLKHAGSFLTFNVVLRYRLK